VGGCRPANPPLIAARRQRGYKFSETTQTSRRGHKLKLFKKRFRLDVKKYGFSSRVVDDWNNLSECCVIFVSINCFKKHISLDPEPGTV